jgi:hypothetical protein
MFEPGDIFLTKGDSFVSRAIRFFSRTGGESRTQVNHTGLVTVGGSARDAVIVEALTKVKRRTFDSYRRSVTTQVAVFRPVNVTKSQVDTIVARADGYVGADYGYLKIVAHFLDWCLGGRYFFRKIVAMDRYPICSWVVAQAYADAGLNFGVPAGSADPDDIWDFCVGNPDKYMVVYPLGLLE